MGLGSALPQGTAVRTAETGWSPSAQAAAAGGAGRQPSSGLSSGARDLVRLGHRAATCVFSTQRVSQGCRFQQWPAVAAACGVGPRGGAVAGRAWRASFYSRGGEGAKTETRESRTDLKGKDAFPCAITSPQVSTGIVSLQVEWLFVCFYGRCFVTIGEIPFSKCA